MIVAGDAPGRGMLSQSSPVLGRSDARGPPERAGEARLRGKPAIESNLAERRAPRRDHCLGGLQPPSAEVAMRRHAHGGGKCPGEMKDAETRDIGEVGDGDVFGEMLFDVRENTAQPHLIEPMRSRRSGRIAVTSSLLHLDGGPPVRPYDAAQQYNTAMHKEYYDLGSGS